jgi:hypothetical protein
MTQPALGFELKEKVASLQDAILSRHPRMTGLLAEIHKTLKQYPENVTLMSEEEVKVIVSGLEMQTQTYLASQTVGKPGSGKSIAAKLARLGDDAL